MADLTNLERVKTYLKLAAYDEDERIAGLIRSESARFQGLVGRTITRNTYDETRDGTGLPWLVLEHYPVASVASVEVDGQVVPARPSVGGSGWILSKPDSGKLSLAGYVFPRGVANVRIVYSAGYDPVPDEVAQAVTEMVAETFKRPDRLGVMSQSIQGESVQYQTLSLPVFVKSVVDVYQRLGAG